MGREVLLLFEDLYRTLDAVAVKNARLELSGASVENGEGYRGRGVERKAGELQEVTKEIVGIHVLLSHSLFACGILRRFLLRVSHAKSTSAPLRF